MTALLPPATALSCPAVLPCSNLTKVLDLAQAVSRGLSLRRIFSDLSASDCLQLRQFGTMLPRAEQSLRKAKRNTLMSRRTILSSRWEGSSEESLQLHFRKSRAPAHGHMEVPVNVSAIDRHLANRELLRARREEVNGQPVRNPENGIEIPDASWDYVFLNPAQMKSHCGELFALQIGAVMTKDK